MRQKHLLTKLMLLVAVVLMGVGTAWAEEPYYTLQPSAGTNNGYANNCDIVIDDITWNLTGNSQMIPWRIGGKSLTNVDRSVYSKDPMGSAITKVDLTIGAASNITVNSLKLIVASDDSFNNIIDEATATFAANSTISFEPTSTDSWETDSYYKFVFNVTVSGSSNKFLEFTKAEFFAPSASHVAAPTFSVSPSAVAWGTEVELSQVNDKPIYYTTDGSDPTSSSTLYESAIAITNDVTIKAIAVDGANSSSIATAAYTIIRPDAPTISEPAGAVEAGTEVTITAPAGCTVVYAIDDNDPVTNGTETTGNTVILTINTDQTVYAASKDAHGFYSSVTSAAYTIAELSTPTFSVADATIEAGTYLTPVVTTDSEGAVSYTSSNTAVATVVDGKIYGVAKGTATITADLAKTATMKAATTTFTVTVTTAPVWESTSSGIDVLTYEWTGLGNASNGYTAFSGIEGNSDAVYAGCCYKSTTQTNIQLRIKNSDSGIYTTTSGGKVRKVTVSWDEGTATGRYLQIYGKHTAYTGISDLYDTNEVGTLLGSIVMGSSTELIITGDYEYIGMKASDPIYMQSITIYWEDDAITLSEDTDYPNTDTAKYAKVNLNRSFVAGWNGIVLPFDLTTSVQDALGASSVKTLDGTTVEDDAVYLNFTDATLPVAAGTPVLVKLNAALESDDVVLAGVAVKTTEPTTIVKEASGTDFLAEFTFTGTYSNQTITDEAYFVSGTKFYHKAEGVNLAAKPFRAYITQVTATNSSRKSVIFDLEGEIATGIKAIEATDGNKYTYNLQGQRISQPNKGLYIINGKKVIVK